MITSLSLPPLHYGTQFNLWVIFSFWLCPSFSPRSHSSSDIRLGLFFTIDSSVTSSTSSIPQTGAISLRFRWWSSCLLCLLFLFLSESCFLDQSSWVVGNDLALSLLLTEDNKIEQDDSEHYCMNVHVIMYSNVCHYIAVQLEYHRLGFECEIAN